MDVVWIPGGMVGWRILRAEPIEKDEETGEEQPVTEDGALLALKGNGLEALFASRDEKPVEWIPIGDFVVEPSTIPEYEDTGAAAGEGGAAPGETPPKRAPFSVRRRPGSSGE